MNIRNVVARREYAASDEETVILAVEQPYIDPQGDIWHCEGTLTVGASDCRVSGRGSDSLDALLSLLQMLQVEVVESARKHGPYSWVGGDDLLVFPSNYPDCLATDSI